MKLLSQIGKHPKYLIVGFGIFLFFIGYAIFNFFYLEFVGVYGVASIKEKIPTSEGIDVKYEFFYNTEKYIGKFVAGKQYQIGDKYFVKFSKNNPETNLLQYNSPVPDCLKDSIHSFWTSRPICLLNSIKNTLEFQKEQSEEYFGYVDKLERGILNINYKDFREKFVKSSQFIIASKRQKKIDSLGIEMSISFKAKNYPYAISFIKSILAIDYTNMAAHKKLSEAYDAIGNSLASERHNIILKGLTNSIFQTGDGKTCQTGWSVIQVTEEGFLIEMLGGKIRDLEVGNRSGKCDKFIVEQGKKLMTYYFETSKILEGYKRIENEAN